jgi:hypothetical protein
VPWKRVLITNRRLEVSEIWRLAARQEAGATIMPTGASSWRKAAAGVSSAPSRCQTPAAKTVS